MSAEHTSIRKSATKMTEDNASKIALLQERLLKDMDRRTRMEHRAAQLRVGREKK